MVKHPHKPEAERFWNFPVAAIEEALGNAIYHRSYEEREPVEVRITPEELLVLSYPGADRSIRMEDLRQGRAVSRRYRNRRIGEFLKELDLAEGRSTGVPKILRTMRKNGSPPPSFETDEDRTWFRVRLPAHAAIPQTDETAREQLGEQDTLQDEPLVGRQEGTATEQDKHLENNDKSLVTPHEHPHDTPQDTPQDTPHDTPQVAECVERLVGTLQREMSRAGLQAALKLRDRRSFRETYLKPALEGGLIEMTLPDKPTSRNQRYRRTSAGEALARQLTESGK